MRIVRTLPHSSEGRFFAGVPAPIWFDLTANQFAVPYAQQQGNRIYVNMLPADEVHFDFASWQGDPAAVAGLKDANNFYDLKFRGRNDVKLPASEKWLGAFDEFSFPPDQFPNITAPPPVPFPYLFFQTVPYDAGNTQQIAGTFFYTLELARTTNGNREVLQTKDVPRAPEGMTYSIRLSIVRKPDGSARLIGCLVSYAKFGLTLGNDVGIDHGGAMQAFFLEADAQSEDCGAFCGYSL